MKKLHMTFLNEDGSKKTMVIKCVHQDLSPAAVKEAMEQIVELDLFEKDGVRLMTEVHSAKYVEIIETPLFEDINEMALPVPEPIVEEVGPACEEVKSTNVSGQAERKQEGGKADEVTKAESAPKPKKQLAKIYPFMTREEWELKKANHRKSQKRAHPNEQVTYAKQPGSSTEFIEPLFAPEQNTASVRQVEFRDRGAPQLLNIA